MSYMAKGFVIAKMQLHCFLSFKCILCMLTFSHFSWARHTKTADIGMLCKIGVCHGVCEDKDMYHVNTL